MIPSKFFKKPVLKDSSPVEIEFSHPLKSISEPLHDAEQIEENKKLIEEEANIPTIHLDIQEDFDRKTFFETIKKKVKVIEKKEEEQVEEQPIVLPKVEKVILKELKEKPVILVPKKTKKKKPEEEKEIDKPKITHEITVPSYFMNNRKIFIKFINNLFRPYKKELESEEGNITCEQIGKEMDKPFSLLFHQKIIRDYMNLYTPYRGLLLYHGLGSGKTCSSIAIAEGLKNSKKVFILTPASLRKNYMEQLKECGEYIYKKNQHWEWINMEKTSQIQEFSKLLNLNDSFIKKQKGLWMVDVTKDSNYETLTIAEKEKLNNQIEFMISKKYHFINYNGLRKDNLRTMTNGFTKNIFDNSVVIIDEGHNLISRIVNKIRKLPKKESSHFLGFEKSPLSLILYELFLSAKNLRIVVLSGTPIINYPNEMAILYNILRGYITTWKFPLQTTEKLDISTFKSILSKEKNVDYIDYDISTKLLTITRNPFDFTNVYNKENEEYEGVSNKSHLLKNIPIITDKAFEENIKKLLSQKNIKIIPKENYITQFKCLPDRLEDFIFYFLDNTLESNSIKNEEMLKKRIMGLTSYFKSAQEELLPKYDKSTDLQILKIPMSDYQFKIYETARQKEREQEGRNKIKKKKIDELYEDSSSTYRIFSRLYCNFVMPDEHPRPLPNISDVVTEEVKEMKPGKERKKCKKGTKKDKDGNCVDKEGNVFDLDGNILLKKEEEKVSEEESEEESDQEEEEKKEEEVKDKVVEKEIKIKGLEAKKEIPVIKRKNCKSGTRKNKDGNCVDKEGNVFDIDGNLITKKEEIEKEKEKEILKETKIKETKPKKVSTRKLKPKEKIPENYGIVNPGINACWLISTIQMLYHIPELKDCILKSSKNTHFEKTGKEKKQLEIVMKSLISIFKKLDSSKTSKKAIDIHSTTKSDYEILSNIIFKDNDYHGRQQDAHEAIINLLDLFLPGVSSSEKTIPPAIDLNCEKYPIFELFSFLTETETFCFTRSIHGIQKENIESSNKQLKSVLTLPVSQKAISVIELLRNYQEMEELKSENKLKRCTGKTLSARKEKIIISNNKYLILLLSKQDAQGRKLNTNVSIDKIITLENESNEEVKFGLKGVVCHIGPNGGGHYMYASYDSEGNFLYLYSDSDVPIDREPNINIDSHILVYERKEDLLRRPLRLLVDNAEKIAEQDILQTEEGITDFIEEEEEEEKMSGGGREEEEDVVINDEEEEKESDDLLAEMGDATYLLRIKEALDFLKENEKKYLTPKGLTIYSPKYLTILQNLLNKENIGLHLIYSQFRTLEGIGIFTLVLDANGFAQFKIKKNSAGIWEIIERKEDVGKLKYALYTGLESAEEKELVRKIYNGEWDNIPSYLKTELLKKANNNREGQIIKCLMITASGSEGINLRNTRFVHIIEPYWNPVRVEQVIGRARRICSHQYLPEELRTVQVFLYIMVFTKKQLESDLSIELRKKDISKVDNKNPVSSDMHLFEISQEKEKISNQLTKCIKESSIDCMVYSKANKKEGLTCLSFTNPTTQQFSYKPDYATDESDLENKVNKQEMKLRIRLFTYKGKKYAVNDDTGEIYKEDNYDEVVGRMSLKKDKFVPIFYE